VSRMRFLMKFGGTSVADAATVRKVVDIMKDTTGKA